MDTPLRAAMLAGLLALLAYVFGPPGRDAAAHLYETQVWSQHGWLFWDNLWYSGRYSQVNYSLTYYPLSAILGAVVVVPASAMTATAAFSRLVQLRWPRQARVSSYAAAGGLTLGVLSGNYPFQLGFAVAMLCLLAVVQGHLGIAVVMLPLTTLSHPLAMVFLMVALAAMAVATPRWWRNGGLRWLAVAALVTVTGQWVLVQAFGSGGGVYPFDPKDAAAIALFCIAGILLSSGRRELRVLLAVFVTYGVLAAASFLVATPLGGNVVRLLLVMGAALLLIPISSRGFRPRVAVVVCLAATSLWQGLPALAAWRTASGARAALEEFWLPAISFLADHGSPDFRVEVVATADNWEAFYLAGRGVPLTRGWYRQDDFPTNRPLYHRLTAATYQGWLRRTGVRYVLLPHDPLDYTALKEAALLVGGRSGLRVAAKIGSWTVYELPHATPIVTPRRRAHMLRMTSEEMVIRVVHPGTLRLRVRYTPYWRIVGGGTRACTAPLRPWGTEVRVTRAGVVRLVFEPLLSTVVASLLEDGTACPVGASTAPAPPATGTAP